MTDTLSTISVCDILFANVPFTENNQVNDQLTNLANQIISQLPEPQVKVNLVSKLLNQLDTSKAGVIAYQKATQQAILQLNQQINHNH